MTASTFASSGPGPEHQPRRVDLEGLRFPRRPVGITERHLSDHPVEAARRIASARSHRAPPAESGKRAPDLVELSSLDPTIKYDIRYATTNNFMSTAFYSQSRALMQRPAAEALVRVHRALKGTATAC